MQRRKVEVALDGPICNWRAGCSIPLETGGWGDQEHWGVMSKAHWSCDLCKTELACRDGGRGRTPDPRAGTRAHLDFSGGMPWLEPCGSSMALKGGAHNKEGIPWQYVLRNSPAQPSDPALLPCLP